MSDLFELLFEILAWLGLRPPTVAASSSTSTNEGENAPTADPNG